MFIQRKGDLFPPPIHHLPVAHFLPSCSPFSWNVEIEIEKIKNTNRFINTNKRRSVASSNPPLASGSPTSLLLGQSFTRLTGSKQLMTKSTLTLNLTLIFDQNFLSTNVKTFRRKKRNLPPAWTLLHTAHRLKTVDENRTGCFAKKSSEI